MPPYHPRLRAVSLVSNACISSNHQFVKKSLITRQTVSITGSSQARRPHPHRPTTTFALPTPLSPNRILRPILRMPILRVLSRMQSIKMTISRLGQIWRLESPPFECEADLISPPFGQMTIWAPHTSFGSPIGERHASYHGALGLS